IIRKSSRRSAPSKRRTRNRLPPLSVIIGARLGIADHIADNGQVFGLALDADDLAVIEVVLSKSRDLMRLIDDCSDEYRCRRLRGAGFQLCSSSAFLLSESIRPSMPLVRKVCANSDLCVASSLIAPER